MTALRCAISIVTTAAVAVAAVTGFGGEWIYDRVGGWMLVTHMTAAPIVILGFTVIALAYGRCHRFDATPVKENSASAARKLLYWALLACVFGSITAALTAMTPLLSYTGQDWLLTVHEWCGMGVVIAGGLYGLAWITQRRRTNSDAS